MLEVSLREFIESIDTSFGLGEDDIVDAIDCLADLIGNDETMKKVSNIIVNHIKDFR
jgi:hypothetical protein